MSETDSRKKPIRPEEPIPAEGEPAQGTPPSELDVHYPGGAPALRRDEFLQGRYPEGEADAQATPKPALRKAQGDTADIIQTVARQSDLFKSLQHLRHLDRAQEIIEASDKFVIAYQAHKASAEEYPHLIAQLLDALRETAEALNIDAHDEIEAMESNLGASLVALQKAHLGYLAKLHVML